MKTAIKLVVLTAGSYALGKFVEQNATLQSALGPVGGAAPYIAVVVVGGGVGYLMFRH